MADDPLARILRAMGHGKRSPLYLWLWDHYRELADARRPGARTNWVEIATALTALGIKTRRGGPLLPETVRRTWAKVSADAKKAGWQGRRTARAPVSRVETEAAAPQRERPKLQLRPPRPIKED